MVGAAPPAAAVVDGERVAIADAPWAVTLQTPAKDRLHHACSGTVIGPRRVLTARHCVEHETLWRSFATVGTDAPRTAPGRKVPIARIWVPGMWDWDRRDVDQPADVAVIETASDLGTPIMPLVAAGAATARGTAVWAYGFGSTDAARTKLKEATLLRRASMTLYTAAECAESDFSAAPFTICARRGDGPGAGILGPGDSGGGLIQQGPNGAEVVGVNALGSRGELGRRTGGFGDVAAMHAFITDPASGIELPRPVAKAVVKGTPRVGQSVRCEASWTPRVKWVTVRWLATRRGGREIVLTSGPKGLKVPAKVAGRRLACEATGWIGEFYGATTIQSTAVEVIR